MNKPSAYDCKDQMSKLSLGPVKEQPSLENIESANSNPEHKSKEEPVLINHSPERPKNKQKETPWQLELTPVPGCMLVDRATFEEMTKKNRRKTEIADTPPQNKVNIGDLSCDEERKNDRPSCRKSEPVAGIKQMYYAVPDPYSCFASASAKVLYGDAKVLCDDGDDSENELNQGCLISNLNSQNTV